MTGEVANPLEWIELMKKLNDGLVKAVTLADSKETFGTQEQIDSENEFFELVWGIVSPECREAVEHGIIKTTAVERLSLAYQVAFITMSGGDYRIVLD